MTEALIENGHVRPVEYGYEVTATGVDWFREMDIDVQALKKKKRSFCPKCLDWTERKHHMAGSLGNSLLLAMIDFDWIRKKKNTRELLLTPLGRKELNDRLNLFNG